MTYSVQIAVDAQNPHDQADWWAETLGWQVEPSNEEFIRSMIAQGFATEDQTTLHRGVLVWKDGAAIRKPGDAGPNPAERMLFQTAPEAKQVKNRVHLDVRLAGDDKDAVRAQLEARGASFLWAASQGPHSWYTMADPEGNEFCIG
ncbi:MAG: VOC family protein [Renibacterium salmoninarum]|nr:VOC family protein [Renibacterium salmoninarum]